MKKNKPPKEKHNLKLNKIVGNVLVIFYLVGAIWAAFLGDEYAASGMIFYGGIFYVLITVYNYRSTTPKDKSTLCTEYY